MAKTTNGLFSLNASGSVGNLTFCASRNQQTVRSKQKTKTDKPTADQQTHRLRIKDASELWAGLSEDTKAGWAARGVLTRSATQPDLAVTCSNGYCLFVQEYFYQHCKIGQIPLRPALNV